MSATSDVAALRARPGRPRRRMTPGRAARRAGFFLLLALFVVASLFPFYWIVVTSLKNPAEIAQGTTSLLPGHVTWGNYVNDLTKQNFVRPLINSAIVCLSATALTVVRCRAPE
jgi:ABC-type glycerol-3-phosphate transport system permease component